MAAGGRSASSNDSRERCRLALPILLGLVWAMMQWPARSGSRGAATAQPSHFECQRQPLLAIDEAAASLTASEPVPGTRRIRRHTQLATTKLPRQLGLLRAGESGSADAAPPAGDRKTRIVGARDLTLTVLAMLLAGSMVRALGGSGSSGSGSEKAARSAANASTAVGPDFRDPPPKRSTPSFTRQHDYATLIRRRSVVQVH